MSMTSDTGRIPEWTRGDRLRKARQQTGLSTRDFAELVGVSQKTITDAENDRRQTRRILLNAWSLATGVPVQWLETGQAPTSPDGTSGPDGGLPRLDSNQQPSGFRSAQVRALAVAA